MVCDCFSYFLALLPFTASQLKRTNIKSPNIPFKSVTVCSEKFTMVILKTGFSYTCPYPLNFSCTLLNCNTIIDIDHNFCECPLVCKRVARFNSLVTEKTKYYVPVRMVLYARLTRDTLWYSLFGKGLEPRSHFIVFKWMEDDLLGERSPEEDCCCRF